MALRDDCKDIVKSRILKLWEIINEWWKPTKCDKCGKKLN